MFQQAINEPGDSPVFHAAETMLKSGKNAQPRFNWNNKLQKYDPCIQTLIGHTSEVMSCAWSPDGQRILSTSWDRTLRVWDANTGKELVMFEQPLMGRMDALDVTMGNGGLKVLAGNSLGMILILQLIGDVFKPPVVQPMYLYRLDKKKLDSKVTVGCP
jgi:hypothetical protein